MNIDNILKNNNIPEPARILIAKLLSGEEWQDFVKKTKCNVNIATDNPIITLGLNYFLQNYIRIPTGRIFYRARRVEKSDYAKLQYEDSDIAQTKGKTGLNGFISSEMGAPPKDKAKSGRANKSKTSVLYLADSPETAMCEIRPSFKDYMSVAKFRLIQDVRIIDFRKINIFEDNNILRAKRSFFIDKILDVFSLPCNNLDDKEYAPTQYIAKYIKKKGFQGLIYPSSRNQGKKAFNLVLFDPSMAKCLDNTGVLYECTKQKFTFENISVLPTKIKRGGFGYSTKKWEDKDILKFSNNMRIMYHKN